MPSIINPQVNETQAPYQFDSGVIMGGANVAGGGSALSPANVGLKAWDFPLILANGTGSAKATAQSLYLAQINLNVSTVISNIYLNYQAAGTAVSTTASFAGLYYVNSTSTATLVASTTQIGNSATVAGFATCPLTVPFTTAASGAYYVGVLLGTSTTVPVFRTANGVITVTTDATTVAGPNAVATNYQYAVGGTSLTVLPTSLTLSSNTLTGAYAFWTGVA